MPNAVTWRVRCSSKESGASRLHGRPQGTHEYGASLPVHRSGPELLRCPVIEAKLPCEFLVGSACRQEHFPYLLPPLIPPLPVGLLHQKLALAPCSDGGWNRCGLLRPSAPCCQREQAVSRVAGARSLQNLSRVRWAAMAPPACSPCSTPRPARSSASCSAATAPSSSASSSTPSKPTCARAGRASGDGQLRHPTRRRRSNAA